MYEVQIDGLVVLCDTATDVMQLVVAINDKKTGQTPKREPSQASQSEQGTIT